MAKDVDPQELTRPVALPSIVVAVQRLGPRWIGITGNVLVNLSSGYRGARD